MKRRQSKRRRELEQFASTHGLSLSDECADPPGERFFLASLNTGDVLGVDDNPMCGSWKGVHLVEMDYAVRPGTIRVHPRPYGHGPHKVSLSVAFVRIPANIPYLCVRRKDWVTRIADDLDQVDHLHHDPLEILIGSRHFDRTFELRGRDAEFARRLCDQSMSEALLGDCRDFAIEIAGDGFVVYQPLMDPENLPSLLDAAQSFHDHIPKRVWQEYGTG